MTIVKPPTNLNIEHRMQNTEDRADSHPTEIIKNKYKAYIDLYLKPYSDIKSRVLKQL